MDEPLARRRVLVVEDEPDIREMIGMVLDATSVPHEDVGDGGEAIARLGSGEYGSMVLDLMMPGTDGFAVMKAISSTHPEFLSRVIVLTGGTPDLISRVDKHVYGVLRKPVVLRELMDAVKRCLDQPAPSTA